MKIVCMMTTRERGTRTACMDSPFNNTKDAPETLSRVYARPVLVGKARLGTQWGNIKGRSLCNNKGSLKSDNK